jgi:hypothetical protein
VVSQESPDQRGASEWTAASPGVSQPPYHASNAGPSRGSPSTHSPHLSNHSGEHTPEAASFRAQEHSYDEQQPPQYGPHIRPQGYREADHYSSVAPAAYPADEASATYASLYDRYVPSVISSQEDETLQRRFPLEDTREACLFRYFIEEIAHWVSVSIVIMSRSWVRANA